MPSKTHFGLTNMRRYRYYSLFLLLLLLFIISIHYSFGSVEGQKEEDEEEEVVKEEQLQMESRTSIIETVKRMFSFPTSLVPQTSNSYWSKFESFVKQGKAYFSPPPTLEESQEAQAREEGGARGEKVKEAVLKSLDKSKATMEESAKSAARLAGDAVQKTKNKVKRTFSFRHREPDPGHQADEL